MWTQRLNAMKVTPLTIPEVLIVEPVKHGDDRGFFSETYNQQTWHDAGVDLVYIQDNHSLSAAIGTIRGLHFQSPPFAQDKLVRVTRGAIWDVAVDIRLGSPTYGQWVGEEISAENWRQILVPKGFAHGFCTLEPDTEVQYKVTAPYSGNHDKGLKWDDPALAIDWPLIGEAQLSAKDQHQPLLSKLPAYFHY
jgi:dTDP-4-dehydrorhamnose 3,5-epimerase